MRNTVSCSAVVKELRMWVCHWMARVLWCPVLGVFQPLTQQFSSFCDQIRIRRCVCIDRWLVWTFPALPVRIWANYAGSRVGPTCWLEKWRLLTWALIQQHQSFKWSNETLGAPEENVDSATNLQNLLMTFELPDIWRLEGGWKEGPAFRHESRDGTARHRWCSYSGVAAVSYMWMAF